MWDWDTMLTCKQNSSTAVGKSRSGLPHLLLLSLIRSAKFRTTISRSCRWQPSGLSSLTTADDGHLDLLLSLLPMTAIRIFSSHCWVWSGLQDLLLLSLIWTARFATAESDLDCKICYCRGQSIFVDVSAVGTATFNVATVNMHNSLNTVAKVLACLQHHVWSEDVVPLLQRNIEKTITSNNTMLMFHTYCLDLLLQDT